MKRSGNCLNASKFVRFYYGEQKEGRFHAVAYDTLSVSDADAHEDELSQDQIDYLRIEL